MPPRAGAKRAKHPKAARPPPPPKRAKVQTETDADEKKKTKPKRKKNPQQQPLLPPALPAPAGAASTPPAPRPYTATNAEWSKYGLTAARALEVLCSERVDPNGTGVLPGLLLKPLSVLVAEFTTSRRGLFCVGSNKQFCELATSSSGKAVWYSATPRLDPLVPMLEGNKSKIRVLRNRHAILIGCVPSPHFYVHSDLAIKWCDLTLHGHALGNYDPPKCGSTPNDNTRPTAPLDQKNLTIWHGTQHFDSCAKLADALCVACGDDLLFVSSKRLDVACIEFVFQRLRLKVDDQGCMIGMFHPSYDYFWCRPETIFEQPTGLDSLPIVAAVSVRCRYVVMFGKDQTKFNAVVVWDNDESKWIDPYDVRVPPPLAGQVRAVTVFSDHCIIAAVCPRGATTLDIYMYNWDWHARISVPPPGQFHAMTWNKFTTERKWPDGPVLSFEGPYGYGQERFDLVSGERVLDEWLGKSDGSAIQCVLESHRSTRLPANTPTFSVLF